MTIAAGIDIGTGFVKIATTSRRIRFPSVIATGHHMELGDDSEKKYIGYDAVKYGKIDTMVLKTPVYRGQPTGMEDYVDLIRHSMECVLGDTKSSTLPLSNRFGHLVIIGGIPYGARAESEAIKKAVTKTLKPKVFKLIFQAAATLQHEGLHDGIVCHIGHGTTEIMAMINNKVSKAVTVPHGVGDIASKITDSNTGYVNSEIFTKGAQVSKYKNVLAGQIQDALEKIVFDNRDIPIICAGGGSQIPGLVDAIKNDVIGNIRISNEPIFSNALGMLKLAQRHGTYI